MRHIVISGVFPTLNEFIDKNRRRHGSWSAGNDMKQADQHNVAIQIRQQLKDALKEPVVIRFEYYRKNQRSDPDNIAGYFHKIFLDAMVQTGRLKNDGWKNVSGFSDSFYLDTGNPRVEVDIWEGNE